MDTFTLDTLNKYINNYKHDIILKLATENFIDKNISTQANLLNMVLDYSPKKNQHLYFQKKLIYLNSAQNSNLLLKKLTKKI